jgi:hypothetical protein
MASLNQSKKEAQETREELEGVIDAIANIGAKLQEAISDAIDQAQGLDDISKKVAQTYQRDIVGGLKKIVSSFDKQLAIQNKISRGENASKEIAKERQRLADQQAVIQSRINNLSKNDVELKEKLTQELIEAQTTGENIIKGLEAQNNEQIAQRGIIGNITKNAKEYLTSLDKSGLASALLSDNLSNASKFALLAESAFLAIAKATLAGSDNIANLEKNLGISYKSAYDLQNSLAITALNATDILITSKDLNKSFVDLANSTGIISDFGGDTLITMTMLTKQLGLGVKEASQLALLARLQGEDTESILDNTVETVNAVNRQRNTSISAKEVLNDIASASASIVVSLGMSPELLAEAATEARALGLNLSSVDKIAGSILEFETSIEKELSFQLLTGKEINLDKARQLALDNDLAGLSEEIAKNSEITEAFATGNRIQQQAAAEALGMSRDELGQMVMQQELLNLSQDEFIAKYGEQSYEQMKAQSASEKFQDSLTKIQSIIGDIATVFAPVIDGFAKVVEFLAESKVLAGGLAGILVGLAAIQATMAVKSIATAYAKIFEGSFMAGPFGLPLALAGAAALGGLIAGATQMVQDGIADSSRGPFTITDSYGKMAMTAKGDSLAVSPNINKGTNDDGKMLSVLEKIANKNTDVYMDSSKVGYAESLSYSKL